MADLDVLTGEHLQNALVSPNASASAGTLAKVLANATLPTQVSGGEKTAGTEVALRSFAPADIKDMVDAHAPGAAESFWAWYDTVALMRAAAGAPSDTGVRAVTRGVEAPNDGGAGEWYWVAASTDTDDGVTCVKITAVTTGRWKRLHGGIMDCRWFGIFPGGVDNRAALQTAIDSALTLYFPPGEYYVNGALTYTGGFAWYGCRPIYANSTIHTSRIVDGRTSARGAEPVAAKLDEPLIHRPEGWCAADGTYKDPDGNVVGSVTFPAADCVVIDRMAFLGVSTRIEGQCLHLEATRAGRLSDLYFEGFAARCIFVAERNFDTKIDGVLIDSPYRTLHDKDYLTASDLATAQKACAIKMSGHCSATDIRIFGAGTACDLTGAENVLSAWRMENCPHGLVLGKNKYSATSGGIIADPLSRSSITGISLEAPCIGITFGDVNSTLVAGVAMQGSLGGGVRSWDSQIGVDYAGMSPSCVVHGISIAGVWSHTPERIRYAAGGNRWRYLGHATKSVTSGRAAAGSIGGRGCSPGTNNFTTPHWLLDNFQEYPWKSQAADQFVSSNSNLVHRGLTHDNAAKTKTGGGRIFAKNFGGSVALGAGVSSATVAFPVAVTNSSHSFTTASCVASASVAPLATGDHFYACTIVGPQGETGVKFDDVATANKNHWKITIGADQASTLVFGGTAIPAGHVMRLYHGTIQGRWNGFWIRTDKTTFVHDANSAAYDGYCEPPGGTASASRWDIPAMAEDDANYLVVVTATWPGANPWVTNKTTTSFNINFGSPPPDASQSVAWLLFRA